MIPQLTHVFGGIKVQVSDENYAAACALLCEEKTLATKREEKAVCPLCQSEDISYSVLEGRSPFLSFFIILFSMILKPRLKNIYLCKNVIISGNNSVVSERAKYRTEPVSCKQ